MHLLYLSFRISTMNASIIFAPFPVCQFNFFQYIYIVQHIYCTYHYRILSHLSVLEKLSMYIVYCICLSLWFHLSSISVAMKWMHHLIHTVKKWIIFYLRFVKLWLMKDHSKLLITKKYLADFFFTRAFWLITPTPVVPICFLWRWV